MNAEQKRAWLAVGSGIVCAIGYLVLVPFFGPWVATAAFALFGLNGFAALIGRREQADERDRLIRRRAAHAAAMASYLSFILGCMGTWFTAFAWMGRSEISVHALGTITVLCGVVFGFVYSLTVLVLYSRRVEAGDA
jgi:hypothetical protein